MHGKYLLVKQSAHMTLLGGELLGYLLEQPISPERLRSRTQGNPSTTLYMDFWRSGTDWKFTSSVAVQIKNNSLEHTNQEYVENKQQQVIGFQDRKQSQDPQQA